MSISAIACTSSPTECDCVDDSTVQIHIPADLAAAAMMPVLSSSCVGSPLTCTQQAAAGGCETFSFTLTSAGNCQIDIDFADGHVFEDNFAVDPGSECCPAFHSDQASASDVEVPEGT